MREFFIAIAGGLVGTIATALIAWGAAFRRTRGEIVTHDRLTAAHDEDLSTWISDDDLQLRRLLREKTAELNSRNLFWSGAHAKAIAEASRSLRCIGIATRNASTAMLSLRSTAGGLDAWLLAVAAEKAGSEDDRARAGRAHHRCVASPVSRHRGENDPRTRSSIRPARTSTPPL